MSRGEKVVMSGFSNPVRRSVLIASAIAAVTAIAWTTAIRAQSTTPPYLAAFPNFAPALAPEMPGDVDVALKEQLEKAREFAKVQREFDLNAWQMFLSLNWPTNNQGQPAPKIEDTGFGPPHWTLWHSSSEIFRDNGAVPSACAQAPQQRQLVLSRDLALPVSAGLPAFRVDGDKTVASRATRYLGVISAVGELNAANLGGDILQAFTGPLIDQSGNFVFYEIILDPNEVSYLCENKLYNINGQIEFARGGKVNFPSGQPQQNWSGATELKLAWKIMADSDDQSRFFVQDAIILDPGPDGKPVQKNVKVGLVGMHIGHKSQTS